MKRILKAIFASVLAMALTLPALSGCGSNSPKDELGEAEGEQIVITPSKETENGGALCMSVSEALEGQAGLETRQVRAQTTPANIPVDWELLWLSVQHSAGAVTDYLSYTFAATIITDGVKWSNRINLTLLERFEGTAMLRVSLKSDPTILDYVTIKAELPKPSIERTVTVSDKEDCEVSVSGLIQKTHSLLTLQADFENLYPLLFYSTVKAVYSDGSEEELYEMYDDRSERNENNLYFIKEAYQLRLERTDLMKIVISALRIVANCEVNLIITCTSIGSQEVNTETLLGSSSSMQFDLSKASVKGGYLSGFPIYTTRCAFRLTNIPASYPFTIEVYYEVEATYEGKVEVYSTLKSSVSKQKEYGYDGNECPKKGNFAITSDMVDYSSTTAQLAMKLKNLSEYTGTTNERVISLKIFFYEGEFDPMYVPSRYAV